MLAVYMYSGPLPLFLCPRFFKIPKWKRCSDWASKNGEEMCFIHMEDRAWHGYLMCVFHSISVVLLFFLFFCFFLHFLWPDHNFTRMFKWLKIHSLSTSSRNWVCFCVCVSLLVFALKYQIEAMFPLHWVCSTPCPESFANIFFK